jgi:hypothetical protein
MRRHPDNREQQKKENKHLFSTKMFTGKALLPVIFLLIGVLVATFQIRGRSEAVVRNKVMKDRCIVEERRTLCFENWARLLHAHSFGRECSSLLTDCPLFVRCIESS